MNDKPSNRGLARITVGEVRELLERYDALPDESDQRLLFDPLEQPPTLVRFEDPGDQRKHGARR